MIRFRVVVSMSISVIFLLSEWCAGASTAKKISPDEVLARVNGQTITVQRFYDHLRESRINASSPEEDEKTKEESFNKLVREILIDQAAASLNMESDPVFVLIRNNHMRDWLLEYMYQKDIVEQVEVTSQEIRDHYSQYREVDFVIDEEVRVRELLIRVWADSTQKDYRKKLKKADKKAKKEIEKLYKKAKRGEDFVDLCREHTQAPVPDRTGDLGFVKKGRHSSQFDSAAFSLQEVGEVSKPFRDERGYHLLQLVDRKEKSYHELDSTLFDRIKAYLKDQKVRLVTASLVDSLKKGAQLAYNSEILESAGMPPDSDAWVMAFGEGDTIRYGEFEEAFSVYKFQIGLDSVTNADKRFFLENHLALPGILKKEAERRGYTDLVEYQAELRAFALEEAEKKFLSGRVKRDFPSPTYQETEEYYQAHKIDFPPLGVPVHVFHIVFEDSTKAEEVLERLKAGADFTEMAKLHFPGEPEIREVAYDLGFITEGEMPDQFYHTALTLEVGEISRPVKTNWGFHLIKVVEKKEKGTTFEEIIPAIHRAINLEKGRKHIADWEENLLDEANVWINQNLLKQLALPKPEG